MGGIPSHDRPQGFLSCTLKCHHGSDELYSVRFARDSVTFSFYEVDSIRTGLEILKLTRSLHLHKHHNTPFFPFRGIGMNWYNVIAGAFCLFIGWQFSHADMTRASIWCEEGLDIRIIHRS